MGAPKISVIVPVYKAEKYIHKCVDTLLAQTFQDYEILLIDDGSPDNSGHICDKYAEADSRINVFHKDNGGVSSARQCGLDNAQGEYIIHADPDDWVEHDMLECLYTAASQDGADMVLCDYYWDKGETSKLIEQKPSALDAKSVLNDLFNHLHGSVCNKLIRTECCRRNNISFPRGIDLYEDLIFNIELLKTDIKISYINQAFYHYVQNVNDNSLTRHYSNETLQRDYSIGDYINLLVKGLPCEKQCSAYMNSIIIKRAFFGGYYNGKEFREKFFCMRNIAFHSNDMSLIVKAAVYLSCIGLYSPIYRMMDFCREHF